MDYLPELYQEFKQQFPEVAKAYDDLALVCHKGGHWMKRRGGW